ncbi:phosphorothioated DNA-binding restriction endonuclease [Kitasatospora sp. NPDC057015]|uniref:phosphorothioated DNA-binding restriction endonuclease n=1 Tax=Kitasatospora sp. NPDC057015 TaxID=3346001 RepID=UPI0036330371
MKRSDLLDTLAGIRQATVGGRRAPHKPLLLLWLFGLHARTGSSEVAYPDAEAPVSALINDYGPPMRDPRAAGRRAAMPFVHLERSLWTLRDADGTPLDTGFRDDAAALRGAGAVGRLRPEVERLLAQDPAARADAVRLLLDRHFTPTLEAAICDRAGLGPPPADRPGLPEDRGTPEFRYTRRRVRSPAFAETVLRAFAHTCAMCGYDGALDGRPVGVEAAHIRWHSQGGPDDLDNALALCSLHHALFDFGVLGVTADRAVRVSPLYRASSPAGRAVTALQDRPVALPGPRLTPGSYDFLHWHDRQVFKHARPAAH